MWTRGEKKIKRLSELEKYLRRKGEEKMKLNPSFLMA